MLRLPFLLEPGSSKWGSSRKNAPQLFVPPLRLVELGADDRDAEKDAADRRALSERYPPKPKFINSRDLMNSHGPVSAAVAGFQHEPDGKLLKVHFRIRSHVFLQDGWSD